MPALETDRILKLDPADHSALLAARIAERDAAIAANDAARKQARAEAKDGKTAKSATDAKAVKETLLTTATAHEATFAGTVVEVKVKHAATDLIAQDEGHNIVTGEYVMKSEAKLSGLAPIEDKRLKVPDADCDAWVASYRLSVRAGFEGADLQRQVNEYEAAHPKIDGEPGKLIAEPEALLDLRKALADKVELGRTEQGKQAAIVAAVMAAAGERAEDYSYVRAIDTATGEIVLGRNPHLTKHDVVIIGEPVGGAGKVG